MPATTPLPLPSKQYVQDRRWIQQNIDALVRDYRNQWIAVHSGRVLAAGSDAGQVAAAARRKTAATDIVIQFVDDGTLIFQANIICPAPVMPRIALDIYRAPHQA